MTEKLLAGPARAIPAEEDALHTSAITLERGDRRRWRITGAGASDVLNGLVTNDISKLTPGSGCYAAALTPKGKVIADLRVFALDADFIVDTSGPAATGWAAVLRKYVNPRLAKYEEVTGETADVAIAGPRAAELISAALNIERTELEHLASHAHMALPLSGPVRLVVRASEIAGPAFDLIVPADERGRAYGLLTEAGAVPGSVATWEVARIANGWPAWGADMDENTLAQEASLDRFNAISYDKGCYTGQETVARVHFRGHVNRYLRRARYSADREIPAGAELFEDSGKSVGEVRSSAISARESGVAIAMVRREVADSAELSVRWNDSHARLTLVHA